MIYDPTERVFWILTFVYDCSVTRIDRDPGQLRAGRSASVGTRPKGSAAARSSLSPQAQLSPLSQEARSPRELSPGGLLAKHPSDDADDEVDPRRNRGGGGADAADAADAAAAAGAGGVGGEVVSPGPGAAAEPGERNPGLSPLNPKPASPRGLSPRSLSPHGRRRSLSESSLSTSPTARFHGRNGAAHSRNLQLHNLMGYGDDDGDDGVTWTLAPRNANARVTTTSSDPAVGSKKQAATAAALAAGPGPSQIRVIVELDGGSSSRGGSPFAGGRAGTPSCLAELVREEERKRRSHSLSQKRLHGARHGAADSPSSVASAPETDRRSGSVKDPAAPKLVLCARSQWAKDSAHAKCPRCDGQFTLFNRRHHCRICGSLACSACSAVRACPGQPAKIRVCYLCLPQPTQ